MLRNMVFALQREALVIAPSPVAEEGSMPSQVTLMGEGILANAKSPSPIRIR
jgi:hypothetical protein